MAYVVIILVVFFALIWACVVSRAFRIMFGLLVIVGGFWVLTKNDEVAKETAAAKASEQASAAKHNPRQAELWSRVSAAAPLHPVNAVQ